MAKREAKEKESAQEDDSEEEESDYEDGPEFLSLEGLTSPMEAWMMVARPKEQEDHHADDRATDYGEGEDRGSLFGLGITTDGKAVADDANIYTTIHDNDKGNDNCGGSNGKSPVQSDHTMESPKPFDPEFIVEIAIPKSNVEPDSTTPIPDDTKEYCHIDDGVEIDVEQEENDNLGSFMDLEDSSDEETSESTPPVSPRTQELRELEEITGSVVPVIRKCLLKLWNEPPDFRSKTKR